ncbi:hypothetical protein ZWY2020_054562, partial [Hordeum vulgare]
APRSAPTSSSRSAPPSPPARFSALVLHRPLPSPYPWLGFLAGLRRRVSDGPRCSMPWDLPIHHCRHHQDLLYGDVEDVIEFPPWLKMGRHSNG